MLNTINNTHVVMFDQGNPNWSPYSEYNPVFLRGITTFLNQRLQFRGHVFLNELFDDLGMKRTTAGALQGWLYDSDNPTKIELKIVEGLYNTMEITIVTDGNIYQKI